LKTLKKIQVFFKIKIKYLADNNINYLSCDMFWNIGDYLSKSQINMQTDFTF